MAMYRNVIHYTSTTDIILWFVFIVQHDSSEEDFAVTTCGMFVHV